MRRLTRGRLRTPLHAAIGAVLAVALVGQVRAGIGPFDCTVAVRPSVHGSTVIRLAPLGSIELDTHTSPVSVELRVDELRAADAERIAQDPDVLADLDDEIAADARRALRALVVRTVLVSLIGGAIGASVGRLSWRSVGGGAAVGTVLAGSLVAVSALTFRPAAVAEPRYTGLMTVAPTAVGDVQAVVERFDDYRAQLSGLVGNMVTLYRAAEGLPSLDTGDDAVRVLHVSDIHNNPQGYDLADELVRQFDIDVVIDTGDVSDFGTAPETRLLGRIGRLGVPYVYVRGNHDSRQTQRAVAEQPGAIVLDGDHVDVAGLRIWGIGDPRFTPDKDQPTGQDVEAERIERFALDVERSLRGSSPRTVDVVAVHDRRAATLIGDVVPLVLTGHTHATREEHFGDALVLVEGSTGGGGLRALEGDEPEPLTASVLYFDPASDRLVAYDRVSVDGLGGAGARIERHVVGAPAETDSGG